MVGTSPGVGGTQRNYRECEQKQGMAAKGGMGRSYRPEVLKISRTAGGG